MPVTLESIRSYCSAVPLSAHLPGATVATIKDQDLPPGTAFGQFGADESSRDRGRIQQVFLGVFHRQVKAAASVLHAMTRKVQEKHVFALFIVEKPADFFEDDDVGLVYDLIDFIEAADVRVAQRCRE